MKSIRKFLKIGNTRCYKKGQIILYQGEKSGNSFYIEKGYIKIYDIDLEGNEKLLVILGPKDLFPLVWTFKGSDSLLYFYESMSDVEIWVIKRSKILKDVKEDIHLSNDLLDYFVSHNKQIMSRIKSLEASDSQHKILEVLDYLATNHSKNDGEYIIVKPVITHQNIADMCGLTRETISLQMKQLELDHVLSQSNSTLKINKIKLKKLL